MSAEDDEKEVIKTVLFFMKKSSQVCSHSPPLVLKSQFHKIKSKLQKYGRNGRRNLCFNPVCSLLIFALVQLN